MSEVPVDQAEVYLRWIYERLGTKMLTKAAKADFAFYVEQDRKIDALPQVSIFDLVVGGIKTE